ncbi:hypothetical protein [Pedobacter sp. V48]|uniref:hypothetical protein n=1 Tax=Pedobacter sp. V48 TaxID=509635 RepID=UPI0003E4B771|nr:hypothetical protein [Pedobacter sp. V48]ETZ23862.1 hypothetical protein N824_15100 [Pedobacter sp. V48]
MISRQSLTTDWLKQVSAKNRKADPLLVEKVIRALLLLWVFQRNIHNEKETVEK